MEILQIIFFVQRSKGLKLHKPLVLQRYRTNNVTYGLSLIEITSITISKIIRACMHKIILHSENPMISMLEGQPEINRKWFNKNIIQFANFCFRVKISQKLHDLRSIGVQNSNVLIFRPVCALEVVLKWLSVQTGLSYHSEWKHFQPNPYSYRFLSYQNLNEEVLEGHWTVVWIGQHHFNLKTPFGPKFLVQT